MVEGYTDTAKETYIECKQRQEIIRAFTSRRKDENKLKCHFITQNTKIGSTLKLSYFINILVVTVAKTYNFFLKKFIVATCIPSPLFSPFSFLWCLLCRIYYFIILF